MQTKWWPALIAAGGALAALLLAHRLARYGCSADLLRKASAGEVVFSCAEFWLNRYQSFLGNVLTAAVAGLTLMWVARQLTAANRQAAVAAAQGLRTRLPELKEELATYVAFSARFVSTKQTFEPDRIEEIDVHGSVIIHSLIATYQFASGIIDRCDQLIGQHPEGERFSILIGLMAHGMKIKRLLDWVSAQDVRVTQLRNQRLLSGEFTEASLRQLLPAVAAEMSKIDPIIPKLEAS